MKCNLPAKFMLTLVLISVIILKSSAQQPVNKDASPEAKALLEFFYSISGRYTLTGQHNYPNTRDRNSRFAAEYSGQTPAIWSTDMGFAKDGDTDSYLARPDIVREAIRQHQKGSLITICWHAVPPTTVEPVTFRPMNNQISKPDSLITIQGCLAEEQYKELMTPGTILNKRWITQVDSVAVYLKKLQEAKVPVLWRPYHEMNREWFWWGARVGEYSTIKLWHMLFDRLVNFHHLNNLIWVWNVDRTDKPINNFSNYYPGDNFLDIVSIDIYGSDFRQVFYDSLTVLAKGKPLYFGEVGNPPSPEVLKAQPNWTGWVIWAGMARNTTKEQYKDIVNDPRMLYQENKTYTEVMNPYRKACGLPLLPLINIHAVDFSGTWKLNLEKSQGVNGNNPDVLKVNQESDMVHVKKTMLIEWGDDKITHEDLPLNGTEIVTLFYDTPRHTTVSLNTDNKTLQILSKMTFERGDQTIEMNSSEIWSLKDNGNTLEIITKSKGFRGEDISSTLIYNKE